MKLRIIGLLLFVATYLMAENQRFVLNGGGLLDIRTAEQINVIGNELKQKTGVNVYLDLKGNNGIDNELPFKQKVEMMNKLKADIVKDLPKPYAVLVIAMDQEYAGVLLSDELKNIVDGADVRDSYVVPLLAAKDKNTMKSKMSAAAFNGYAQITDSIAQSKGITLINSIGSEGKVASTIWRVFMYTLVFVGIVLYTVIVMREKKIKKALKEQGEQKNGNE